MISVRLHTGRLKVNPAKNRKKHGHKSAVTILKDCTTVGLRISGHRAAGTFNNDNTEGPNIFLDQFDECDSKKKLRSVMQTFEKTEDCRSEKFKSKFFISAVPTLCNFRTSLRKRLKDRSDVPAGDAWRSAKNVLKLKETDKATFFSPTKEWCLPAPSVIKLEEREFIVDSGASMHIVEQENPELCRIGNRKGLQKSGDRCHSQR